MLHRVALSHEADVHGTRARELPHIIKIHSVRTAKCTPSVSHAPTCTTEGIAGEPSRWRAGGGSTSSGIGLSSSCRKLGSGSEPKNGARGGWKRPLPVLLLWPPLWCGACTGHECEMPRSGEPPREPEELGGDARPLLLMGIGRVVPDMALAAATADKTSGMGEVEAEGELLRADAGRGGLKRGPTLAPGAHTLATPLIETDWAARRGRRSRDARTHTRCERTRQQQLQEVGQLYVASGR